MTRDVKVLCLATQGEGSSDEQRLLYLLQPLHPELLATTRSRRASIVPQLLRRALRLRPDVVVLEGTGLAGGAGVMLAKLLVGVPYVVSSGDAVAPFLRLFHPFARPFAGLYERALCALSSGYIGWTPYLVGRALSFGAPRAMTAAHFAPGATPTDSRTAARASLGIPQNAIVIGIAGSILTDPRRGYSYGQELISALRRTTRPDLRVLVVGGGDGLSILSEMAADDLGRRVLLLGRRAAAEVPGYLSAMDIGALSQSVDAIGAFRYTTKLPEYVAAGLPVLSLQTPASYDLDTGWMWRLPGDAPWDETHIEALAQFMSTIGPKEIAEKRANVPQGMALFDPERQQRAVCEFVSDIITARGPVGRAR
jgi:glycosyltransferase involved in cell wall biosynthesis